MSRPTALYTPLGIAAGTLLGSLAAGTTLLWLNYRSLGAGTLANKVAAAGLTLYLLVVVGASMLPNGLALGLVFILAQTGLAYWAAEALQGEVVRYHLARGSRAHSTGRAAVVGLLTGLAVTLVLVIVMSLLGLTDQTGSA